MKVRGALLEMRQVIDKNGTIKDRRDNKPVLERYWLLLKYGCNLELDRGSRVWQDGRAVEKARNMLVHYNISKAPSLTTSQVWEYLEAVMLLFITPSVLTKRTLLSQQFDLYSILVRLYPLISKFEEKPLHKECRPTALIFNCPFDGIDEVRYPHSRKS